MLTLICTMACSKYHNRPGVRLSKSSWNKPQKKLQTVHVNCAQGGFSNFQFIPQPDPVRLKMTILRFVPLMPSSVVFLPGFADAGEDLVDALATWALTARSLHLSGRVPSPWCVG